MEDGLSIYSKMVEMTSIESPLSLQREKIPLPFAKDDPLLSPKLENVTPLSCPVKLRCIRNNQFRLEIPQDGEVAKIAGVATQRFGLEEEDEVVEYEEIAEKSTEEEEPLELREEPFQTVDQEEEAEEERMGAEAQLLSAEARAEALEQQIKSERLEKRLDKKRQEQEEAHLGWIRELEEKSERLKDE